MRVIARPAFKNAARNPYNALLYRAVQACGAEVAEFSVPRAVTGRWDIYHLHWPESLLETGSRAAAQWSAFQHLRLIDWLRWRGARVVWTVHDLKPHDMVYPDLEQRFWDGVLRRVDAMIALTRSGLALAHERYPAMATLPAFVVPHGHYRGLYPNETDRAAARLRLGLPGDAAVIAYLGQIRPYKNVPRLIQAFRGLGEPDARLLVCGRLSKRAAMAEEVMSAAAGDARIRLELRYIADDEVQLFLNAADLCVFPYRDILNSGSAILALSFDRPVLVPNRGAMAELQGDVGNPWVRTYDGELDAAALQQALRWAIDGARPAVAPLRRYEWTAIAEQTIAAYRAVSGRPRH